MKLQPARFIFLAFGVVVAAALFAWDAESLAVLPETRQAGSPNPSGQAKTSCRDAAKNPTDPLVVVPVTVVNYENQFVSGLSKDNFQVFEDGKEQEIVCLAQDDVPASIGILADTSGSIGTMAKGVAAAVNTLLNTSSPGNEYFLLSFDKEPLLRVGFSKRISDFNGLSLSVSKKVGTALLDAIYLGLEQFDKAENAKRVLLVLTDGGENGSRHKEKEISEFLKRSDIQFYAVGIYHPLGFRNRTSEELNGPSFIAEMTELTGGRAYPVENVENFIAVTNAIRTEIRVQYVLGYQSDNRAADGKWRKIKVKVRDLPRRLSPIVYTRKGYYAVQK